MSLIFSVGDRVAVLDDTITGIVIKIDKKEITIETTDGFVINFQSKELVSLDNSQLLHTKNILQAIKEKEQPKKVNIPYKKKINESIVEIDLHIEKLVVSKKGMSNFDILNLQLETAKRNIELAIKNKIPRIVFIHGVGEGVLKTELEYLFNKYEQIIIQDANFQKYGFGATEIYFKQNIKNN